MVPAPFDYHRPQTLDEAVAMLNKLGDDAKVLAGGHSLVPAMKLRLSQPKAIVDLGGISDLNYIREAGGMISIGAMTTHTEIERSDLLVKACPLLPETAGQIGDVQVRNRGTIGGSLVHADPAADWPASVLALDAEMIIAGPNGQRTVKAADFFVDLLQTAVQPGELLCEIRARRTSRSVAYVKFAQKASGFAIAGVAAIVDTKSKTVNVGITGVAAKAYRAQDVEKALKGKDLNQTMIAGASNKAAEGIEPLRDIHASAEFRAHLAVVSTRRALELALSRAQAKT